jgi:hypothetical protein
MTIWLLAANSIPPKRYWREVKRQPVEVGQNQVAPGLQLLPVTGSWEFCQVRQGKLFITNYSVAAEPGGLWVMLLVDNQQDAPALFDVLLSFYNDRGERLRVVAWELEEFAPQQHRTLSRRIPIERASFLSIAWRSAS